MTQYSSSRTARQMRARFLSSAEARIKQKQSLLPADTVNKGWYPMESPAIKFAVIDTAQISQLYLQRPTRLAAFKLGQWFLRAHGIKDQELERAASSLETKLLIVKKGLNTLPLLPLKLYNESNELLQNKGSEQ